MRLTYIYHSGFAIEGENFTIIIDYYRDSDGENDGIVHDSLLHRAGKLYVLSTHSHSDHFNPEILKWKQHRPDIQYIFSRDILEDRHVRFDGAVYLFHAGDLNNWHWKEESTMEESAEYEAAYLHELEILARVTNRFDLVMFPIDPRLGREYMLGAEQFVCRFAVGCFVPMHFHDQYEKAAAFRSFAEKNGSLFIGWSFPGETVELPDY